MKRVEDHQSGRVDRVLATSLGVSRNQVEALIKEGCVFVNGKEIRKTSFKVVQEDEITYTTKEATKHEPRVVDFEVQVLYEDEAILVVNKPSGLVVHPAPSVKEATLVDWLRAKGVSLSTLSGEERHGIVHRIDKETTGALVIAKSNEAHEKLSHQLQDKSMGRYYLALIDHPLQESTIVDKPIARHRNNRLRMDVVEGGKVAKSAFVKLVQSSVGTELIAAKLFTGRTHQIRVHLKSLGRHILGDSSYGFKSKRDRIPRVYLHAYLLYLIHPTTGKKMEFMAPLFGDMQGYMQRYLEKGLCDEAIHPSTIEKHFTGV
jgi:23S rRNA pseudouridine1911/1915/1917 synthase